MMQWTVRLEVRTSADEVKTTELVTISWPAVVSTLAEVGLALAETKALLAKLQASMLCGQKTREPACVRIHVPRSYPGSLAAPSPESPPSNCPTRDKRGYRA